MTTPPVPWERALKPYEKLVKQQADELARIAAVGDNQQKGGTEEPTALQPLLLPVDGRISSPYGVYRTIEGVRSRHEGVDIAAPTGTPIYSLTDGKVIYAEQRSKTAGLGVMIRRTDGVEVRYFHCSRFHVEAKQRVTRGTLIAEVGNTGKSTGPHLHVQVNRGGKSIHSKEWPGMQIWMHTSSVVADILASITIPGKSLVLGNVYTGAVNSALASVRTVQMSQMNRLQLAQATADSTRKRLASSGAKVAGEVGKDDQLNIEPPERVADVTDLLYEDDEF